MSGAGPIRTGGSHHTTTPDLQQHEEGGRRRRTRRRRKQNDAGRRPKTTCRRSNSVAKSDDVIGQRIGFSEEGAEEEEEAKTIKDTMDGEEEEGRKSAASNDRGESSAKSTAAAAIDLDRFCCRLKLYADSVLKTQSRFSELLDDLSVSAVLLGCPPPPPLLLPPPPPPPHHPRPSEHSGGLGSSLSQTEIRGTPRRTNGAFGILRDVDVSGNGDRNPAGGYELGLDAVVNGMQQEEGYFADILTQKATMTSDSAASSSSALLWPQPKKKSSADRSAEEFSLSDPAETEIHDNCSPTEGFCVAPLIDGQNACGHKPKKYRWPDDRSLMGRAPGEEVPATKRAKMDDFLGELRYNSTPTRREEEATSWNAEESMLWPGRKRKDGPGGYLSAEAVRERYLSAVSTFARLSEVLSDRRRSKGRIDAKMERLRQELNRLEAAFFVEKARLEQDGKLLLQSCCHRREAARNVAAGATAAAAKDPAHRRSDENSLQQPRKLSELLLVNDADRSVSTLLSSEPNAINGDTTAPPPPPPPPPLQTALLGSLATTPSAVSATRLGTGLTAVPAVEPLTSGARNNPDEGCFQNQTRRSVFCEDPEEEEDDDVAYRQSRRFSRHQPLCSSTNLPAKGTLSDGTESKAYFESCCNNLECSHAVTPEDRTRRQQVSTGCRLPFNSANVVCIGSDRLPSISAVSDDQRRPLHTRTGGATETAATCCNNKRIFGATGSRTASRDPASWTFPLLPATCCSIGASESNLGHVTPATPIFDDVTTDCDVSGLSELSAQNLPRLPLPLLLPPPPQVGMSVGPTPPLSDSHSNGLPRDAVSYEHDVIVDNSLADVCYSGPQRWGYTADDPHSPIHRYPHLVFPSAAAEHPGIRQLPRPRNPALDEAGGRWLCG